MEIGRDPQSSLVLDDHLGSRRHVRLTPRDHDVVAEDRDLAAWLANIGQGDGRPGLEAEVEAGGAEAVVDYVEEPGAS